MSSKDTVQGDSGPRENTPSPLELQPKALSIRGILCQAAKCLTPVTDKTEQSIVRETGLIGLPIVGCVLGYLTPMMHSTASLLNKCIIRLNTIVTSHNTTVSQSCM